MVIGVIGASLAGLTVARELGKQGHQVTVFEKAPSWSGRFTTVKTGTTSVPVDTHIPYITAKSDDFKQLLNELTAKGLLKQMDTSVNSLVKGEMASASVSNPNTDMFVSTKGMDAVAQYLARYCDVRFNSPVVGVTYIGTNTKKKKPWMINLTTFEVFELDSVVVAVPAPQAYSVLENTQDETPVRKVIAEIDEITYAANYTLTAVYPGKSAPDWTVLETAGTDIELMVNESKKTGSSDLILTIQSTAAFFDAATELKANQIVDHLLKEATALLGEFAYAPESTVLEKRKYAYAQKTLNKPFTEVSGLDGKLGLVGDYFLGFGLEEAYHSGLALAKAWK